uniref:Bm1357 n=1 Tax=Brugia malayi TaxID=6279 RepID=A0A1I9G2Q4_BRUMA|nr:Bm1357 [Brugia malayi]
MRNIKNVGVKKVCRLYTKVCNRKIKLVTDPQQARVKNRKYHDYIGLHSVAGYFLM